MSEPRQKMRQMPVAGVFTRKTRPTNTLSGQERAGAVNEHRREIGLAARPKPLGFSIRPQKHRFDAVALHGLRWIANDQIELLARKLLSRAVQINCHIEMESDGALVRPLRRAGGGDDVGRRLAFNGEFPAAHELSL